MNAARFLFVTWDGGGNFVPALAVAGALAARGHEVAFIGQDAIYQILPEPFPRPRIWNIFDEHAKPIASAQSLVEAKAWCEISRQ